MSHTKQLPKLGLLYMDYVLRFFDKSNFKGWPDKIEVVTYHWKNDKQRFINEVKRKKIDVLVGNIPATAYETFKEIAAALPHVRFIPSIETQFPNKSKENVTLFCEKYDLSAPKTEMFYDVKAGYKYLETATYPKIVKRSYGPSNYGGYYVHKVDNKHEAKALFDKEKYVPMYIQDAIDLKDSGDLRVMLIGHKPICAFWRYSGAGEWITNTSQGGSMSYENVPMNALELAVKASKAAKAEYWACDIAIDAKTGEAYILECATAFAAFPYIRDWICAYIMWDLSDGRFKKPNVPLFSWEELGKVDSSLLRMMRHIDFASFSPSADGAYWLKERDGFSMELAEESLSSDVPASIAPIINEKELPSEVRGEAAAGGEEAESPASIRVSMEEAVEALESFEELSGAINLNSATLEMLVSIDNIGEKAASWIIEHRQNTPFERVEDIMKIKGLGKKKFEKIAASICV